MPIEHPRTTAENPISDTILVFIHEIPIENLRTTNYWKFPFIADLPINSMVIFNSYVKLPEGNANNPTIHVPISDLSKSQSSLC